MNDAISKQQAIDALGELATFTEDWSCHTWMYTDDVYNAIKQLPTIQPEPHEIGYDDCSNALLKMWMDNVLTDGEYYRIADKLNEKWDKT